MKVKTTVIFQAGYMQHSEAIVLFADRDILLLGPAAENFN
jgi:hypothetical protein